MEMVIDIETFEIVEVIDSDNQNVENTTEEIIEEETLVRTSGAYEYLDEPRKIVQLTLFDDNFYSQRYDSS